MHERPTIYLGEHPETKHMVLPVIRFLTSHPDTYLMTRKLFSFFNPIIKTVSVDITKHQDSAGWKNLIEEFLLTKVRPDKNNPPAPVARAVEVLSQGHNLLMFPSGQRASDATDWKPGIGKILLELEDLGVDPWITFVYLRNTIYEERMTELYSNLAQINILDKSSGLALAKHLQSLYERD